LNRHHPRLIAFAILLALAFVSAPAPGTAAERMKHTVEVGGHPVALWEKSAADAEEAILLVHGRTWSAVPDFDLQVEGEDLSLMDGLVEHGYAVFAVDLRGYGATPRDDTGWLTPRRAAQDLAAVLEWIAHRKEWRKKPHLFGWSMGSTNSLLMAQSRPELISSLTLFGYWHDLDSQLPADEPGITPQELANSAEAAASDFITPGSISQKAIDAYVAMALQADPVKTDLRNYDHYNALDPSRVLTPTLVMQGEHDPIAPTVLQTKLYTRIGNGHKQWVTVPGGDHAAFLEAPRSYFIHALVSFIEGVPD
jgi:pimeloyl-ACP methyl ester carboxylesterase